MEGAAASAPPPRSGGSAVQHETATAPSRIAKQEAEERHQQRKLDPPRLRPPRPQLQPNHSGNVTDAPPFWQRHSRTDSTISYHSVHQLRPPPILLEDHSGEGHEQSLACWASGVAIDEHVVVSGPTGIGAYVVWHCTLSTMKGGDVTIWKRYSEFDQLRTDLVRSFPDSAASIPDLPRNSVISRFRPTFLEQRKNGLAHFLNCVLLNPEFASSPILKDFVFS